MLERKYPEPALVKTAGFRDTLEIGRQRRQHLYDPYQVKSRPLISRSKRFAVSEKLGADGMTVKPLDRDEARQVAERIAALGIKNIAIAFINSYVDGRHEQEMREILLEVIPDARIALSSETRLQEAGSSAQLLIVKSNGGMMHSTTAKKRPEELIESGPAGGVAAGSFLSEIIDINNMIITDVGGTSFEACLMENGRGLVTDEYELEWDMPITTPMLDIRSIGAGGGRGLL